MTYLRTIANGYLEALEFTECSPDTPDEADAPWSEWIFTAADIAALAFAQRLPTDVRAALEIAIGRGRYDWAQVGHDLWFTRNGHGTGFWDRDLGDLGEALSDIARDMGETYAYINDSGELDISESA